MAYVKTNWVNGLTSVNSTNLNKIENGIEANDLLKAPLASPVFTGTPTAPTASIVNSSLQLATTQFVKNGMSDIYKLQGTYVKSFTTVLMHPSGVSVSMMNANHKRLHHSINWKATTPMILSSKHKK